MRAARCMFGLNFSELTSQPFQPRKNTKCLGALSFAAQLQSFQPFHVHLPSILSLHRYRSISQAFFSPCVCAFVLCYVVVALCWEEKLSLRWWRSDSFRNAGAAEESEVHQWDRWCFCCAVEWWHGWDLGKERCQIYVHDDARCLPLLSALLYFLSSLLSLSLSLFLFSLSQTHK